MAEAIFERRVYIRPPEPGTPAGRGICVITARVGGKVTIECWDEKCECAYSKKECTCYSKTEKESMESAESLLRDSGYKKLKEIETKVKIVEIPK